MATQAVLDLKPTGDNFQRVLDLLRKYNASFTDEYNLLSKLKNQCLFNVYSDDNLIIVDIMYIEYDANNNTETKLLYFIQERILAKRKVTIQYFSSIDLTKQVKHVKNKKLRFSHIIIKPTDILKKAILAKTIDELNIGMGNKKIAYHAKSISPLISLITSRNSNLLVPNNIPIPKPCKTMYCG